MPYLEKVPPSPFLPVLGDSHVRSFSGSTAFVPIFVGEGRKFNFSDGPSSAHATDTLLNVVGALGGWRLRRVVVYASEPAVRVGGRKIDDLPELAFSLAHGMTYIRETFDVEPIVIASPPVASEAQTERAQYFNECLRGYCLKYRLDYVDLWPETSRDRTVASEFFADGIHLNAAFGNRVAMVLVERGLLERTVRPLSLDYVYHVALEGKYPIKVRAGARMEDSKPAEERTRKVAAAVDALTLPWRLRRRNLVVLGCADGYPALRLSERANVVGIDSNISSVQFANNLAKLFGAARAKFLHTSDESCGAEVKRADLLVVIGSGHEYANLFGLAQRKIVHLKDGFGRLRRGRGIDLSHQMA